MNKLNKNVERIRILYLIFILIISMPLKSCSQSNRIELNSKEALFRQYSYLLQKSFAYIDENKSFIPAIQNFIDTCKEYNFRQYNRLEPVILQPILFNVSQNTSLVMVLTREYDLQKKPVEYIHFLYVNVRDSILSFRLKKGYVRTFSYTGKYSLLSDQEMTLIVIRSLIDLGYMESDGFKINDDFFKDDW